MAYLTITACCTTPDPRPELQHTVQLHSCEEKMALITDVFLVVIAAAVAFGSLLTANGLIDLGPLNSMSTLGPEVAYGMLGAACGVAILNTIIVVAKMSSHISRLATINHTLSQSTDQQTTLRLETEKQNLTTSLADLEARLNSLTLVHTQLTESSRKSESELQQENIRLQKEAVTLQENNTTLSTQTTQLSLEKKNLEQEIASLKEQVLILQSSESLEKTQKELKDTQERLNVLNAGMLKLKTDLEQERENREALESQNNQAILNLSELEGKINVKKEELNKQEAVEPPALEEQKPVIPSAIAIDDPVKVEEKNDNNKKAYEEALTYTTKDENPQTFSLAQLQTFKGTEATNKAIKIITDKTVIELDALAALIRNTIGLMHEDEGKPVKQDVDVAALQKLTKLMTEHLEKLEDAFRANTANIPTLSTFFNKEEPLEAVN